MYKEHLLVLKLISFTACAKVTVVLSLLTSTIAVEISDKNMIFIFNNPLQAPAKAIIPKCMACSSFLLIVQCIKMHRYNP
ncbi:MAG: hypothetical protein EZS28_024710 [Streblomastix strix]|uniref:Uncharacterized protein n=1 Tax=Streblomastix strix TaxID=222440 RepID=A0A5J4VB53_9EUKA|nr:MAG: hypothetical protein EZS28_024710 [Streblomastix strix]